MCSDHSHTFSFQRLVGGKMSQVRLKVSATASFFYVPHLESSGWTYISEVKFRPRWLALSPSVTAARDHLTASNLASSARSTSNCFRMRKLSMYGGNEMSPWFSAPNIRHKVSASFLLGRSAGLDAEGTLSHQALNGRMASRRLIKDTKRNIALEAELRFIIVILDDSLSMKIKPYLLCSKCPRGQRMQM